MLRMWYVTDGWNERSRMRIRCKQQSDRPEDIKEIMSSVDIDYTFDSDRGIIRISSKDSREFLSSTSPPPGFKYKWENDEKNAPHKLSP